MRSQLMVVGDAGRGAQQLGDYVAYLAGLRGLNVATLPSPCTETSDVMVKRCVTTSRDRIDGPIVEDPDFLVIMNRPSTDFVPMLKAGGTLIVNSSLVPIGVERDDIDVMKVPATEIAMLTRGDTEGIPDLRMLANSVMFGVYLSLTQQEPEERLMRQVYNHFLTGNAGLVEVNIKAVRRGYEFARSADPLVEYGR